MAVTPLREERTREDSWAPSILAWGIQALNARVLLWVVTLGAVGVWIAGVLHPDPWRLVAATGYCLTVLVPFVWKGVE